MQISSVVDSQSILVVANGASHIVASHKRAIFGVRWLPISDFPAGVVNESPELRWLYWIVGETNNRAIVVYTQHLWGRIAGICRIEQPGIPVCACGLLCLERQCREDTNHSACCKNTK